MIAGVPLLALGITVSRSLERVAALLLAASLATLGASSATALGSRFQSRAAKVCLAVSGAAVIAAMLLGVGYALRDVLGLHLDIAQMARTHGWLNGIGFAFAGLLAWTMERRCSSR